MRPGARQLDWWTNGKKILIRPPFKAIKAHVRVRCIAALRRSRSGVRRDVAVAREGEALREALSGSRGSGHRLALAQRGEPQAPEKGLHRVRLLDGIQCDQKSLRRVLI